MRYILTCALGIVLLNTSCKKKADPVINKVDSTVSDVKMTIQNMAGTQKLALNTWYVTDNGDSLQVNKYAYFISNIKLTTVNGIEYKEQESYHLVDQDNTESGSFTIKGLPVGTYKSISFMIGVDSARNVSGAQTGALDASSGMFWDWNTGYIMAKLEGVSPKSTLGGNQVLYHIAGFSGLNSVLRTVTLPVNLTIQYGKLPKVHINANILEWFKTPNSILIKDTPLPATTSDMAKIADNYADMFSIDYID